VRIFGIGSSLEIHARVIYLLMHAKEETNITM